MAGVLSQKAPDWWEDVYRRIRKDVFALCRLLNFEPTKQQAELFRAVMDGHKRIAVKSGQGTGKTTASAILAIWRVIQREESKVIVTAPSMRQVQDVFMAEIRRLINRGPKRFQEMFFFTIRKVYVGRRGKDDDSRVDWGIQGVTATDPRNAQGYHGDNISFFIDESSGVPRPIIEQIEGTLTQPENDFLHLHTGNPNTQDCAFYDFFTKARHDWKCLTFDALSSPRVSREHCEYMKRIYGERSDVYRVRVLGEFPTMEANAIIALDDLEACAKNDYLECVRATRDKQFGIDLARYGSDESVIVQRSGLAVVNFECFARVDPNKVVKRAFVLQGESHWEDDECIYVADADGMGQGVMERFHDADKELHEFHTSAIPSRDHFHDKMSEAWFGLARLVKQRKIWLPNDPDLIEQLSCRFYEVTDKGKVKVESKKKYRERTERSSPDRADAMVMAFYDGAMSQAKVTTGKRTR